MAAATDWISPAEAHLALNIPDATTTFDAELALYISAVSQRLDLLAGAAVTRVVTNESHTATGKPFIELRYRPVTAVATVTEYTGITAQVLVAETNAAKTVNDYLLVDAEFGWLRRRASGSDASFPAGRANVVVTYTAGRAANTAAVDPRYKLAASIYLSHLWRREQGAGTATFGAFEGEGGIPGFGIPHVVRDLLANDLAAPAVA